MPVLIREQPVIKIRMIGGTRIPIMEGTILSLGLGVRVLGLGFGV